MNEIEGRVRAAMLGATEQAPAGLLERVYRRHRRHRRRAIAGYAAAAVAVVLAVPPIGHELAGRAMPHEPGVGGSVGVAPVKTAAPGTLLLTCNDANWGQLQSGWRAGSFHAGPLWFAGGRQKGGYVHDSSFRLRDHQGNSYSGFRGDFMIVEVADGSTVTVKPVPAARSYFWFSDGLQRPEPQQAAFRRHRIHIQGVPSRQPRA